MQKKVIITGASGMIGATLAKKFIDEGTFVYAVVRVNSKKIENLSKSKNLVIVECNVDNLNSLVRLIKEDIDEFYHFAWDGTFGTSRDDVYLQNLNVRYTIEAVEVAKKLGCSIFVGAGSQAEYGMIKNKISPDSPINPETGYGIAKYAAGKLSRIHANKIGICHIWGRILSVYGPCDNEYTMVMSTINKLFKGEKPSFTRGEQLWDYIYCEDAAEAFKLMGEKGKDGSVYCIGSGNVKPLAEYIRCIRDNIGENIELGLGEIEYLPNQVMYLCADISKLTQDTGFVPKFDFELGIKETIKWACERFRDEKN